MWTSFKRVFRAGFLGFWRNAFVSFSALFAMVEALFIFGVIIFAGLVLRATLEELQSQADMSITFMTDAPESRTLELRDRLFTLPQVADVSYSSREEELATFREAHKDDQLTLNALDELDTNPLGARLTIEAREIGQYATVADFLKDQEDFTGGPSPIIDKINYFTPSYQFAILRLEGVINSATKLGIIMITLFSFATILVCFSMVRLAIFTSRDEIHVMRLVGAGKAFIRGPFIIQGALQGLIAGILTLILFYPFVYWLRDVTMAFSTLDIFNYYLANFPWFFLIFVGGGLVLGGILNFLAVRRYLTI